MPKSKVDDILAKPILENFSFSADPRTPGVRNTDRWTWIDALYMAPPALAALARATGDRRYLRFVDGEFKPVLETLEGRRLMSAVNLVDGMLILEGKVHDLDRDVPEVEDEGEVAEGDTLQLRHEAGDAAGNRSPFIEDVVGRQLLLGVDGHDLATGPQRLTDPQLALGRGVGAQLIHAIGVLRVDGRGAGPVPSSLTRNSLRWHSTRLRTSQEES